MKTLLVPFQINSNGGLATTDDTQRIVEQQILDIIMTNFGERVMRPTYGADLRSFLFSPARADFMQMRSREITELLRAQVQLADIVNVSMSNVPTSDSTVRLRIDYAIKPSKQVITLSHTISGLITEETNFA